MQRYDDMGVFGWKKDENLSWVWSEGNIKNPSRSWRHCEVTYKNVYHYAALQMWPKQSVCVKPGDIGKLACVSPAYFNRLLLTCHPNNDDWGFYLYPEPESNRQGKSPTGFWDQRVYLFRHPGISVEENRNINKQKQACEDKELFLFAQNKAAI